MLARPCSKKVHQRDRDERGFVMVWMALIIVLLLSVAAFAVDLVHGYVEAERAQKAADAAALAGASQIPYDLACVQAQNRAGSVSGDNGFPDNPPAGTTESASCTGPNEVTVNVSKKFDTFFAKIIGIDSLTVRKHAVAQYDAPLAMGSPANNVGDVPHDSCTQLGFSSVPVGTTEPCVTVNGNDDQSLWAQIQGQSTFKTSGNAFTNNACSANTDGCVGTNSDYDGVHQGEYFSVVNDADHSPLYIYVYDAGFVDTKVNAGPNAGLPCGKTFTNPPPHYADSSWCTGDRDENGAPGAAAANFDTNYEMLSPDSTPSPRDNPPYVDHDASHLCEPTDIPASAELDGGTVAAVPASYWQQWRLMCTIQDPGLAGSEWILHVSSLNSTGKGTNQFSILALHTPPTAIGPSLPLQGLQVFSRDRLPLYATKPGTGLAAAATFYLARVLPSSRQRTLTLNFFDLGDSAAPSTGTLKITTHNASFGGSADPSNCNIAAPPGFDVASASGPPWGTFASDSDCTFSYDRSTWNGQWVTVTVPIPPSYTCNTGAGSTFEDCWLQLQVTPDTGATLADATTWTASMAGSPVRLVG